ncbi:MAG: P1 family peptidase [Desulfobacteraceae bacterium]
MMGQKGMQIQRIDITDISGIQIGHARDLGAATGCTVLIADQGATAGVDVRGGTPGTRDTDLLNPVNLVDKVHGVVLSGGSAFGLAACSGVMRFLEERDIGLDTGVARIPIVCGAVLFDLGIGDPGVRPDEAMGYQACLDAGRKPCAQGNVGAGAGATVGKIRGMERAMKSGLGTCGIETRGLKVGALVAVNSLGDVIDPASGAALAGVLSPDRTTILNTEEIMISHFVRQNIGFVSNTTIGIVITNAALTKSQATKVASMAHNGYARSIRPAHTMLDGDTLFTVATGQMPTDISVVGMLSAKAVQQAVISAVRQADPHLGFPCSRELAM